MRPGPLAGVYPAVAAMVVLSLVPYLALSAALQPLTPIIAQDLHMSLQTAELTYGIANAGYAVGTVLAVQLAQHWPQRRLMVIYAALLVVASMLAAAAPDAGVFIAGHILQGLCTSLLLIATTPPLIIGYPRSKLRPTALILNLCIFGAVALGPFVGGVQANSDAWRPLFWIVAGIAVTALVLAVLTFQDAPAADPSAPRDPPAIGLAAAGCVLAFFGASQLLTHHFLEGRTAGTFFGGLALIVILLVYEYGLARHPLLTIRTLVSTMPVAGIGVAMCAAAAASSAIGLTGAALAGHHSPLHNGLLFLPLFGAAVLTAVVFATVFQTRLLHYLALAGMVSLSVGIVVVNREIPPTTTLTLVGTALIGIGLGASVVPALFVVGFSQASANVQRVFAIVELLRAVAAFMIAPIIAYAAVTLAGGTKTALWICFGISAGGALFGVSTYALSRVRPPTPDVTTWLEGRQPAWYSPPLLAGLRGVEPISGPAASADGRTQPSTLTRRE